MAIQVELIKELKRNPKNPYKVVFLNWLESMERYEFLSIESIGNKDYILASSSSIKYPKRLLVLSASSLTQQRLLDELINEFYQTFTYQNETVVNH